MGPVTRGRNTRSSTASSVASTSEPLSPPAKRTKIVGRSNKEATDKVISPKQDAIVRKKKVAVRRQIQKQAEPEPVNEAGLSQATLASDNDFDEDFDDEPKALVIEEKIKPAARRGRKPPAKEVVASTEDESEEAPKSKRVRKTEAVPEKLAVKENTRRRRTKGVALAAEKELETQIELATVVETKPAKRVRKAKSVIASPEQERETIQETEPRTEQEQEAQVEAKPAKRGRKAKIIVAATEPEPVTAPEADPQLESESQSEIEVKPAKRGRKAKTIVAATEPEPVTAPEADPQFESESQPEIEVKPVKRGRKAKGGITSPEPEAETVVESKQTKRGRKAKSIVAVPEKIQDAETQLPAEVKHAGRGRKPTKKTMLKAESKSITNSKNETLIESEDLSASQVESAVESEPVKLVEKKRGRPAKVLKVKAPVARHLKGQEPELTEKEVTEESDKEENADQESQKFESEEKSMSTSQNDAVPDDMDEDKEMDFEPVDLESKSKSNIESITSIQKVVYTKKVTGKTIVQRGTVDYELTSNNSLYLEAKKDVALVVEKLKFETEQSFQQEDEDHTEAKNEEETKNNETPVKASESSILTDKNVSDDESFDAMQTTFVSSPSVNENTEHVLNSTMDNYSLKRKASDDTELIEREAKRREPSIGGNVYVMGDDISGELGLGEFGSDKSRPFPLPFDLIIGEVSSLSQHNAILTKDGRLYTFGCNDECALGRSTADQEDPEVAESTPVHVPMKFKVEMVTTGDSHTAVLCEDGTVFYWGAFRDSNGVIGLSATVTEPSTMPIEIQGKFIEIASGANFLLLLSPDGYLYSIGNGERGELGRLTASECKFDKTNRKRYFEPQKVVFNGNVKCDRVWAGEFAAFARSTDGHLYAWGLNNYSQLGFQPPSQEQDELCIYQPKEVKFFNGSNILIEKVSTGQHHSLALDSDGRLYSYGRADYGRLGHGKSSSDALEPTLVEALQDKVVVDISCSTCASFAVTKDGELYSWGMGSSVLGLGVDEDVHLPTRVKSKLLIDKKVIRVSAGSQHCLFIATSAE